MQFPERDLSCQYISSSYQDVLQQYVTTGSLVYILDGLGNVVFTLPSASIGNVLITSDVTASMTVLSASYSSVIEIYQISSSFASSSLTASTATSASYAYDATFAYYSELAGTASLAAEAITASYAETASYANYAGIANSAITSDSASVATSASYAFTASVALFALNGGSGSGTSLGTGSTYPFTASYAETASFFSGSISNAISASYALTASYAENQGIAIPRYDYSYVEYNGPYEQFSKCTYKNGGISGSIVCIINAYYSGSLFIGISKSLG